MKSKPRAIRPYPKCGWSVLALGLALLPFSVFAANRMNRAEPGWWLTPRRIIQIINENSIAKMKDGVMIINTSHGPLVIEQDLADALNSGKVAGAAVDVVSKEPISLENPLLKARNCIITPHIAWAPKESRARLINTAVENLGAFSKESPVNMVKA